MAHRAPHRVTRLPLAARVAAIAGIGIATIAAGILIAAGIIGAHLH